MAVIGAAVIWIALLGPVIALLTHLSGRYRSSLTAPGALDPLVVSVERPGPSPSGCCSCSARRWPG